MKAPKAKWELRALAAGRWAAAAWAGCGRAVTVAATAAAALALLAGCTAPAATPGGDPAEAVAVDDGVARTAASEAGASTAELARWMSGRFSSRAQAQADARFLEIELRVQPIWPARDDGPWLYVEQASAEARERPYRQRVYRLGAVGDALVSWVYTLPGNALDFAGAPQRVEALDPAALGLLMGCEVRLRPRQKADGTRVWVGGTVGTGCASRLRGATHATADVVIDANGMTSWDRGFDAAGRQVWGSEAGGYRFERVLR
jgi:CpeT protein